MGRSRFDNTVPVIAIAPSGPLLEKTASNLQEAAARGGQVIVFGDRTSTTKLRGIASRTIVLPTVHPIVAPVLYAIAVQMLAYHVAVLKGTDVDQPRNLAKSVTVESAQEASLAAVVSGACCDYPPLSLASPCLLQWLPSGGSR